MEFYYYFFSFILLIQATVILNTFWRPLSCHLIKQSNAKLLTEIANVTNFVLGDGSAPAVQQTTTWMCYNDENVYIKFLCKDSKLFFGLQC